LHFSGKEGVIMATAVSLSPNIHNAPISFSLEKAHDIPKACIELAKTLKQAPVFDQHDSKLKCTVVALLEWTDARICHIFNENVGKILGRKNSWHIHDFGFGADQFVDTKGMRIKQGVILELDNPLEMCSYEALEASYNVVFFAMISGWQKADLKDHPDILCKEDPKEFDLFIKKTSLIDEDILLRFILRKFSLFEKVQCGSQWLKHPGCGYNGKLYLWIKKTELDGAVEKIGFKLEGG
jgi:hypothetical protein